MRTDFCIPGIFFPDGCGAAISQESESDYQEDLLKNPKLMCVRIFYCSNAIIASASADVSNLSNLIMCYLKYASLKFVLGPKYFLEAIASLYFFVMKFAATYVLFVTGWAQV